MVNCQACHRSLSQHHGQHNTSRGQSHQRTCAVLYRYDSKLPGIAWRITMNTLTVEHVPLASVRLDPHNVRAHPPVNIAAIKGSLARFGQQTPIVIDSHGVCRKGNGTVMAAVALGWTSIAVIRTDLADPEAAA